MQIRLSVRDIRRVNNDDGSQYGELVRFQAPEAPENAGWAQGVPSASLDLYITNPAAFGSFVARGDVVFDITPVAATEAPAPQAEQAPAPEPAPSPEPVQTEQAAPAEGAV